MPLKTARHRVLEFIRRRRTATAAQIAHGLDMSVATVRHHLGILTADGRIVVEKLPGEPRRGRPEKAYRLSEKLLGDNTGLLADVVLRAWLGDLPKDIREAALLRIANLLSDKLAENSDLTAGDGLASSAQKLSTSRRLVQLTQQLSAHNYQAGWEAGAQGPRIVLGHCPYAAIIADHPELCIMDAYILSLQLGARARQILKMDLKPGGVPHCVFAVEWR